MNEWGVFWLRVALALYSVGLWHSFSTVIRRRPSTFLAALTAISVGLFFHFVSIAADVWRAGGIPPQSPQRGASWAAFLITLIFLVVYRRYRFESLSVFVFPIVFVLTLFAGVGGAGEPWLGEAEAGWGAALHVGLFLIGYAALFVTFIAGVMYLIQERELKSRKPRAFYYRLPPLTKIEEIGSRTLALGFIAVTLGLIVAGVSSWSKWGARWVVDPTIALAFVTWAVYLAMVFSRWTVGWRGRKSAYFAIVGFCCAALSWIVNSGAHSFPRP